jgi:hypothetical protein
MDGMDWTQFLRTPTGKDASAVVFTRGHIGARELGNLIRILELQRGWLIDDEAAEGTPIAGPIDFRGPAVDRDAALKEPGTTSGD